MAMLQGQINQDQIRQSESNREQRAYLNSKITRLGAAIYRVTDYFNLQEPLRWEMRSEVTKLLSTVVSYTGANYIDFNKGLHDIKDISDKLLSYIDLLATVRMLSDTNQKIIKDEIIIFKSELDGLANIDYSIAFQSTFSSSISQSCKKAFIKDIHSHDLGRGQKILDFIAKNGPVSVGDLHAVIKNCSEKTVQRELVSLIKRGLLKREGERRWSRYLVVENV